MSSMNASLSVEFPQTSVFHLCFSPYRPTNIVSSRVRKPTGHFANIMMYQAAIKDTEKLRKGPWLDEEDTQLIAVVALWGQKRWDSIARASGLRRSGKSCRLRWLNYLRPNLKHDPISLAEEQVILKLQEQWGNKWSRIAGRLPGRTDNEIKNYWRTHLRRKVHSKPQEHILGFTDGVEKGSVVQNCNTNATNLSYQCFNSATDISGATNIDTFDVIGSSSSSGIENSAFESPSTDWISGLSEDHQSHDFNQNCTGSFYTGLFWNTENDDVTGAWDYFAGSLWDLD